MDPLRICFVASEVAPFAKTGGLGDVCAALPRALASAGHDVRVFLPLYARVEQEHPRSDAPAPRSASRMGAASGGAELRPVEGVHDVPVALGGRTLRFSLYCAPLPGGGPHIYFVHCPTLYARPGIYTQDPDEHLRFLTLCHAALLSCQRLRFAPHIVHCHDWQTGLLPIYVKTLYAWDRLFHATRTVLTLHNLGYQGVFPASIVPETGLYQMASRVLDPADLREQKVNFLKTGVMHADALTTVSPTYAREIQTPAYSYGLDELLRRRQHDLTGILNGVDVQEWSPRYDRYIAFRYSAKSLWRKERNKELLLSKLQLRYEQGVPLVGIVSRLAGQKGFDLLPEVLPGLLAARDLRLVVLGSGEARYEQLFAGLQGSFPGKVCFHRGFSNELAHWIEAGSDLFLMPSKYEPCGLNQMYSLLYGTVPVVRRTGGLADTVKLWDPASGSGNGVVFDHYTPEGVRWGLQTAMDLYLAGQQRSGSAGDRAWRSMQSTGMGEDFSWERQAARYVDLYRSLAPD